MTAPVRGWRVGADVGGTFTDVVLVAPDGSTSALKIPSTPDDFARGVIEGVRVILDRRGLAPEEAESIAHGTTAVTNTILQRSGARTALLTTSGFRDVLEIGRMRVPRLYDIDWVKPLPLVERDLRFEIPERLDARGEVVRALDEEAAREVLTEAGAAGITSLAVCLLHSYAEPAHERRLAELAAELLPGVDVSISSDVLREPGEYERTSTTVVNAYVRPTVRAYFTALESAFRTLGVRAPVRIMKSDGGLSSLAAAADRPVTIVESGPAAGVVAALEWCRLLGIEQALSFDMGGTTAKACLIEDGRLTVASEYAVGAELSAGSRVFSGSGYSVRAPALDIAEVGAGGGSILWIDGGGLLRVGPRSAGAVPGPVAYRSGGDQPTITDANVVLGYLGSLADGDVALDVDAARDALTALGRTLGLDAVETAAGARRVAISTMGRALKSVSTERGHDPRSCSLIAFGGNGPGHAADLAEHLGMTRVIIPPLAGVLSAVGLSDAVLRREIARPVGVRLDSGLLPRLVGELRALADEVAADLVVEAPGQITIEHRLELRYHRHSNEVNLTVDLDSLDARDIGDRLAAEHDRLFGLRPTAEIDVVAVRAVGTAESPARPPLPPAATRRSAPVGERQAVFAGVTLPTPVYDSVDAFADPLGGPALVDLADSTIVVPPGWTGHLVDGGCVVLERNAS
jgi:N-methylhydantoinase A